MLRRKARHPTEPLVEGGAEAGACNVEALPDRPSRFARRCRGLSRRGLEEGGAPQDEGARGRSGEGGAVFFLCGPENDVAFPSACCSSGLRTASATGVSAFDRYDELTGTDAGGRRASMAVDGERAVGGSTALRRFGGGRDGQLVEVRPVCGLPALRAAGELWRMAPSGRQNRPVRRMTGTWGVP